MAYFNIELALNTKKIFLAIIVAAALLGK